MFSERNATGFDGIRDTAHDRHHQQADSGRMGMRQEGQLGSPMSSTPKQ